MIFRQLPAVQPKNTTINKYLKISKMFEKRKLMKVYNYPKHTANIVKKVPNNKEKIHHKQFPMTLRHQDISNNLNK